MACNCGKNRLGQPAGGRMSPRMQANLLNRVRAITPGQPEVKEPEPEVEPEPVAPPAPVPLVIQHVRR